MSGGLRTALAVLVAFALPAASNAAISRIPLGKVSLSYDTAAWRVVANGQDGVTFTCIAADCVGQPRVFVSLSNPRDIASTLALARRDGKVIPDDAVPAAPLEARAFWSGCRANDTPILFAGGQVGNDTLRFITAITQGCNFAAPMPQTRFMELLHGIEY